MASNSKIKQGRWRGRIGDVFTVQLGPVMFAHGQICATTDMAFFDLKAAHPLSVSEVLSAPVLFRVPVWRDGISKRPWHYIGNLQPQGPLAEPATYRVQPVGSNQLYKTKGHEQTPATVDEVIDLEPMAWWFCEHVEDRLRDWYLDRQNNVSESMRRIKHYDSSGQEIAEEKA